MHKLVGQAEPQRDWRHWLQALLPPELGTHLVNVVAKPAELVVFADSAAWCARLRYALAALEDEIAARDAQRRRVSVRVAQEASAVGGIDRVRT